MPSARRCLGDGRHKGSRVMRSSPFALGDESTYRLWRDAKLSHYPLRSADLLVELRNPASPTAAERAALLDRCRHCNMALYAGPVLREDARAAMLALGECVGLRRLDANMLADDDGITPITVMGDGVRARYIPYTDRPLAWHTDGYYNTPDRTVRGLLLYLAQDAAEGGGNALLDPEIAYIVLRDEDPGLVAALMRADALTIPANAEPGMPPRPEVTGPVFTVEADGTLHMRFSARTRNVVWRDDPVVARAVALLNALLTGDSPYVLRHRMAPGQGLLCNNVLHNRDGFRDSAEKKRLLLRARYYDRVTATGSTPG
ncbi:MAG TPA: TauD/TfdA family dioxygenase [Azospirillum sp.]|nr:TauD/TfdA family dioxygenase [Azospirillum sp.]